jgi:hypothetical protein
MKLMVAVDDLMYWCGEFILVQIPLIALKAAGITTAQRPFIE